MCLCVRVCVYVYLPPSLGSSTPLCTITTTITKPASSSRLARSFYFFRLLYSDSRESLFAPHPAHTPNPTNNPTQSNRASARYIRVACMHFHTSATDPCERSGGGEEVGASFADDSNEDDTHPRIHTGDHHPHSTRLAVAPADRSASARARGKETQRPIRRAHVAQTFAHAQRDPLHKGAPHNPTLTPYRCVMCVCVCYARRRLRGVGKART